MTNVIIFVAALVLAIVLGQKLKTNVGALALAFAFICGSVFFKMTPNQVVASFPVSLFFYMFIGSYFYGFGIDNGTFQNIAQKILYRSRRVTKIMPISLDAIGLIVTALGAGTTAGPVFLSPIVFSIILEMGVHPLLGAMAVFGGTMGASMLPWTSDFAQRTGMLVQSIGAEGANKVGLVACGFNFLFMTVCFLIAFIIPKGYKGKAAENIEPAPPMTREQKITLGVICTLAALIVIPVIIDGFFKNPVTAWIKTYLDFRVLASVGAVVCHLCKLGDIQTVLKTRVPWNAIVAVCCTGTLVGMAQQIGVADTIGQWIAGGIPAQLVAPLFTIVCGALSLVVSGSVLVPMMAGLIPGIAMASGLNPLALASSELAAIQFAGFSQFTMGGTMAVIGCTDEKVKSGLVVPMIIVAVLFVAATALCSGLGLFEWIYSLAG